MPVSEILKFVGSLNTIRICFLWGAKEFSFLID